MDEISKTTKAVEGIVKAVPIYEDLLQPAARQLGKGLGTIASTVNVALSPISALVWGYEHIKEHVQESLEEKLANTPKENIVPPEPSVAGPTLENMRYFAYQEELREMFMNLLATSMDKTTSSKAHPSFVEVIKQLNPDEAKILKLLDNDQSRPIIKIRAYNKDENSHHYSEPVQEFSLLPYEAKCNHPDLGPSYLVNINRLGLAGIDYSTYSTRHSYDPLYNHSFIKANKLAIEALNKRVEMKRGTFTRSQFGKKFYEACIKEK